jgi:1-acyl-sn-glycerol-3-phosphate acyltransferase
MVADPAHAPARHVQRHGNAVSQRLARSILGAVGWRIEGEVPDEPKLVVVGAPHTSYYDFLLAKLTSAAVGARFSWVGKKSLFPRPLAPLVRLLGGIPVNREAPEGFVAAMVEEFRRRDHFYLALMPEGGLRHRTRWRTGFYYIAWEAEVPILLIAFDWGQRTMRIGPMFRARDDTGAEEAVERLKAHFEGVRGRRRSQSRVDALAGADDRGT